MKQKPYLRASFLEGYGDLVLGRGGKPAALMGQVGLPTELAQSQRYLISLQRFSDLLELSAAELEFPCLGLALAQRQDHTLFGPLSQLVNDCDNLGQVFSGLMRLMPIQVSGLDFDFQVGQGRAKLQVRHSDVALAPQLQQFTLAKFYKLARTLSQGQCPLRACHFTMAEPADTAALGGFFNCPMGFGQDELSLVMDAQLLAQPVGRADSLVAVQSRQFMEECSEAEFMAQVENVMANYIIAGQCRLADVAAAMATSGRSLQRRLAHNGSSYQYLLNGVRARLAKEFLQRSCYRLTDIALMLGYKQLSSFSRSYQRWYGECPSQVVRDPGGF
ncbi:MAG: AraC family transcriptional regulator [Cellvibrionaceae bacterium]|nr:AraC family transcriptional regulator [Cellvibrionaceae bacterium]MCV6625893.1 AraC family transcriptional regulator [Cellvibrionaceae bacterium]